MRILPVPRARSVTLPLLLAFLLAFESRGHADQFVSLPGGTALTVTISSPAPGTQLYPGLIEIKGNAEIAHLAPPKDTTLLFVVDRSGSMAEDAETDCDGDGESDSRYKCVEIAVKNTYAAASSSSSNVALVGLSAFWECPHSLNLYGRANLAQPDPGEPYALLAPPGTDGNNNGKPDLMEAWQLHPYLAQPGGYTCMGAAFWSMVDLYLQPQNQSAKTVVVLLSDGIDSMSANAYDGDVIHAGLPADILVKAFAVPGGVCHYEPVPQSRLTLKQLAQKSVGGTCQELNRWDKIGDFLTAAVVPTLLDIDVTVDGEPAAIATSPDPPLAAPANVSYTAYAVVGPGEHEICATAEGKDWDGPGEVTECITVQVISPATVSYAGDTTQDYHDVATLSATLTGDAAVLLAGQAIAFTLGSQSCSGTTDASGLASCSITLTQAPGAYTVDAAFAGDTRYAAAGDSDPFVITREEATVLYTGIATQDYHDIAVLSATLTEDLAPPLAGKAVSFTLGSQSCNGLTDAAGHVACSIVLNQMAGTYTAVASFSGDDLYDPAGDSEAFAITREEMTLDYTGLTLFADGAPAVLSAVLKEDGTTAPSPAGQAVNFTLGTGATKQVCTGTADAGGTASCTVTPVNQPLGPGHVSASFAGDQYYDAASDETPTLIYGLTGSGAFVIGDRSATPGATINWWGSQWADTNALSGGRGPSAFKGFASAFSGPLRCGISWESSGGTSSNPPASVPSYMAVIVSSAIGRPDSRIRGDATEIAIVRINPGYAPNAGHEGYGVIVAKVPCY